MAIVALDDVLILIDEVLQLLPKLLIEPHCISLGCIVKDELIDENVVIDVASLLCLEDEVEIFEFEPHVHEVRMDQALYDLLVLTEQDLYWFFALDVLGFF